MKFTFFKKNKLLTFFILILIFLSPFIKNKFDKGKFDNILVQLYLIKKCYQPSEDDFETIFIQENLNYTKLNNNAIFDSLKKLSNLDKSRNRIPKIPKITHHVYFSSTLNQKKLNDFYEEKMKANLFRLNSIDAEGEWQHFIWTNVPEIFSEEIKNIKGIKMMLIEEFENHRLYDPLKKLIEDGNQIKAYWAEASDIVRLLALHKFGGIYNDMDYEIYNAEALYELMKKYDSIFGREQLIKRSYYGNAFMASKKEHPIITEALKIVLRNTNDKSNSPEYINYICSEYDKIYFNGPPAITISYFLKSNIENNNDIVLPPWMIFNVNFARYKNETCSIENIDKDDFIEKNKILSTVLSDYTKNIFFRFAETFNYEHIFNKSYVFKIGDLKIKHSEDNIYYSFRHINNFPIIGADMFCGSWTGQGKYFKRKHYWRLLHLN